MENQHRQISGYRELSQEEIDCVNRVKAFGATAGALIGELTADHNADGRSVAIAKTHFQEGLMWLNRAIMKPESF